MTRIDQGAATDLLHATRELQPQAEGLLEQLVRCETPSTDRASQQAALDLMQEAVEDVGLTCRRYAGRTSGGTLVARRPGRGGPWQLLVGHCDTVWPIGTLDTMPLRRDGDRLHGPGAFDMKAGLTQMVIALRALRACELEPEVAPVILVNSDEEVGTQDTHGTLRRLAAIVDRAFVLEPSLAPDGRLKTARKGVVQYNVTTRGRAAHAGLNPEDGVSAIAAMAELVPQIQALNDPATAVNVNVGTVRGGTRPNVVPEVCHAEVDVRVPTRADAEAVDAALRRLNPVLAEVTVEVSRVEGRLPMEFTEGGQVLWHEASALAEHMGFELGHGRAGGGSDGNITSQFTPTLDGLGAVGDGAHSAHEHVLLSHMPARTALLAGLLMLPPMAELG